MVEFICSLSGKRTRSLLWEKANKSIEEGKRGFLLVPEQQVLAYEAEASKALPPSAPLTFKITSFSLLSEDAQRYYGSLSHKTLSKVQKLIFIWKAIRECSPFLKLYGKSSPESLSILFLECIDELKAAGITPDDISDASSALSELPNLSGKLSDIAMIFSAYSALVGNKYSDVNDNTKKLLNILSEKNLFSGFDISVDSFTDFTNLQLSVIKLLIRDGANITFSLPCDPTKNSSVQFECVRETYSEICAICERYGKAYTVRDLDEGREPSSSLEYLSANLFSHSPSLYKGEHKKGEETEIFSCHDMHEEIAACINLVKKSLYDGYKLSDIAIISREPEKYEKLLSLYALDAGIPLFCAEKKRLSDSSFAVYMLSLLRIIKNGWQREDVIAHLKSGLTGIDGEDINRFDLYTARWGTNGRKLFCGKDFSAPYAGFKKEGDKENDAFIISSNRVKNTLFPRICEFEERISKAKTLNDMLKCLFAYIEESGVTDSLREIYRKDAEEGNIRDAEYNSRIYRESVKLFDEMAYAFEFDREIPLAELTNLCELLFFGTEISSIPTRKEEVVLADASTYRSFGHKVIIMPGMSEGAFPRALSGDTLITDSEKSILKSEGLPTKPTAVSRASKEYLFLWRAVNTANEKLYMTYPLNRAGEGSQKGSIAVRNINLLLGSESEKKFSSLTRELTYDPHTAFSGLSFNGDAAVKKLADDYCKEHAAKEASFGGKEASLYEEHSLKADEAEDAFALPMNISPTSLEAYNRCAFAYFCKKLLSLDDGSRNEFSALISGTLIHEILEKYFSSGKKYSDSEAEEVCRKIADEYYSSTCPEHLLDDARLKLNFTRAAINASLLARFVSLDAEQSAFKPFAFEERIGASISEDGSISINGKVDRIDSAKGDGDVEYLRIIDYKSGNKQFSLEELEAGTELQLPLYLSSLLSEGKKPGGFLYLSGAIKRLDISSSSELGDISLIGERLVMSVNSSGVMNSLFAKKSNAKLQALADGEIKELLGKAVCAALGSVARMRQGDISASPHESEEFSPCDYCPYMAVCRRGRR